MEWQALVDRVERLERENRRARRRGACAVAVLGVLLLVSAAPRTGPDVVEARRVRVVDESGRVGVEIDADSIAIAGRADAAGRRVRSRLSPDGLEAWSGDAEATHAVLELTTKEIDLVDYARERRAVLNPVLIGLQRGIAGASERPAAWVATLRESGLEVQDLHGTPRARLGRGEAGDGVELVLYDAERRVVWRAPGE